MTSELYKQNIHFSDHFTQLVWKSTKEFGIGKAHTRGGKLIVVANYRPSGNIIGQFQENVLPKIKDSTKRDDNQSSGSSGGVCAATDRKKSFNNEDMYSLNEQSINTQSLIND